MFTITLRVRWWLLTCSLAAALGAVAAGALWHRATRPRVYIAGYPVTETARDVVRQRLSLLGSAPVELTWRGEALYVTPAQLGMAVDVEAALEQAVGYLQTPLWHRFRLWVSGVPNAVHLTLPVQFDDAALRDTLAPWLPGLETPPEDARLRYGAAAGEVISEVWGRTVDWDELRRRLARAVQKDGARTVSVPVRPVRPRVTADALAGWNGLYTIGEAATAFDPRQTGRTHNIRLAAERIDGYVLWPGDEFSLNRATGERTEETGYREGTVIVEGELASGIGGGVSQLASTLFNAALAAGLELTEYHNHTLPVPYLPPGRDATVWYGSLDLRFVNTLSHPVVIHAVTGGDWVRVLVRSPQEVRQHVTVETQLVEEIPRPVEERLDPALVPGERRLVDGGQTGQRFVIRQIVAEEGKGIVERRLEAFYPPKPQVWLVGPAPG